MEYNVCLRKKGDVSLTVNRYWMIDENFIEFCCLDKLIERREAIQVGPNLYFQNMSNAGTLEISLFHRRRWRKRISPKRKN